MLALVLYPVVIEPNFALADQAWLWTMGYGVLVLMVVACGLLVWRQNTSTPAWALAVDMPVPASKPAAELGSAIMAHKRLGRPRLHTALTAPRPVPGIETADNLGTKEVTWARRVRWIGLAAAPTSLMLGVTTYLTTDIAAIPFIWVIPLALYLLTFILVFARWPIPWVGMPHKVLLYAQPCLLMALVLFMVAHISFSKITLAMEFSLHLLVFFTTALVCHGELAKDRPAARQLTDFYLCMSVGGVLGGMFNALVAPQIFWFGIAEYYLAMVLACCLRPSILGSVPLVPGDTNQEETTPLGRVLDFLIPVAIGFGSFYLAKQGAKWEVKNYFLAVIAVIVLAMAGRPLRFGLALLGLILGVEYFNHLQDPLLFEGRSFFGFVKVRSIGKTTEYHTLVHGVINHGSQIVEPPDRRRETITYFHPTGGVGQIFKEFSWPDARLPASLVGLGNVPGGILAGMQSEPPYAVVGLGIGILAAHAKPWQHVVYYEIDPLVKRLSLPPEGEERYFYYLHDAIERGAKLEVVMGDGRQTLKKDPYGRSFDGYYHIIVIDAFSSDAIPVHLLTGEAIDLYMSKLVDGGILVFNTTNRYVNLPPVLGKIAQEKNLTCLYYGDFGKDDDGNEVADKFGSDWVVMQRKNYAKPGSVPSGGPPLDQRRQIKDWQPAEILDGPMWTDSYSNLLRVFHW